MKYKYCICLLFLFLFTSFVCVAQTSFQYTTDFGVITQTAFIQKLPNNRLATLTYPFNLNTLHLSTFTEEGDLLSNYALHVEDTYNNISFPGDFITDGTQYYCSFNSIRVSDGNLFFTVAGYNSTTNVYWAKRLGIGELEAGVRGYLGMIKGNVVTTRTYPLETINNHPIAFSLSMLNTNGYSIWDYSYAFNGINNNITPDLTVLNNQNMIVMASGEGTLLAEIDSLGTPVNTYYLQEVIGEILKQDANENIYISGRIFSPTSENPDNFDAILIKVDSNYNLIWSKKIKIEKLTHASFNFNPRPDGTVFLAYSGLGNLPIIVSQLSEDGEVLYERGYPFLPPQLEVMDDNSIVFFTSRGYLPNGEEENRLILAKTNPDGTFDDCPTYTSCIRVEDFETSVTEIETVYAPTDTLPNLPVSVEEVPLNFEPYCNTPDAPDPYFFFPDTLCLEDCWMPDSLRNFYAHAQEWRIFTPSGEEEPLIEEKEFEYCFEETGTYLIEQKIWFLGCEYYFERTIDIVASVEVSLGNDRVFCEAGFLDIQSNRPLETYLWNTGSEAAQIWLSESGEYHVITADVHCPNDPIADTVFITMIANIVEEPVLTVPADTFICERFKPFLPIIESNYTNEFYLNNSSTATPEIAITQAGAHTITAFVEDCPFSEEINVDFISCIPPIYIPNVFSPNNDGINDWVQPEGQYFQTEKIEVFDRWGGLIFQEKGEDARWNGGNTGTGIYVFQLTYRNLLTNEVETLVQDVLLMK